VTAVTSQPFWLHPDNLDRAVDYSLALGLYAADGAQAGFARLVTDRATFAWLCDVFVDAAHRGHGLGTFLARRPPAIPTWPASARC
jgi:GNAT superfamily N-acetyltransferase